MNKFYNSNVKDFNYLMKIMLYSRYEEIVKL